MRDQAWLNTDLQLAPGAELFSSERRFQMWASTVSHGQLLFRSAPEADGDGTTVEVLFKPVQAVKIRSVYRGLRVRCATTGEADEIRASLNGTDSGPDDRVFLLHSEGTTDYVLSMAVGWATGILHHTRHSFFNSPEAYDPQWPTQPLGGVNPGFNLASGHDLINALLADAPSTQPRERFRMVYVLMARTERPSPSNASGVGVFLTMDDAEDARAVLSRRVEECWIETLPVAL